VSEFEGVLAGVFEENVTLREEIFHTLAGDGILARGPSSSRSGDTPGGWAPWVVVWWEGDREVNGSHQDIRISPAETYCAAYTGSTKMKLFSGVI